LELLARLYYDEGGTPMAGKEERFTVKLTVGEDDDIIEFLKDKPKGYFVKLALRRFINEAKDVLSDTPTHSGKENRKDDAEELFGNW
jgi:hypothetical protein